MTIGISLPESRFKTSKPLMPGICTSRNTMSGDCARHGLDRLAAVPALTTDIDVVELLQANLQAATREFFVVNDQGFQHLLSHREY